MLVAGGAGAVGHAAIELGVWSGARVISTVSGRRRACWRDAAGADVVVNYRDEDAAEQIRAAAPDGVARIVELALGPNLALDLAVTAPHGVISTYAADSPSAEVPDPGADDAEPDAALRARLHDAGAPRLRAAIDGVCEALAVGALTTLPVHRFVLEQTAAAHDAVEGGAVGKVLIDMP